MTTPRTTANTPTPQTRFRLPDPPPRHPDEMTSYDKLSITGNVHHLVQHFGNPDATLVAADRWIAQEPHPGVQGLRRPDLLIAFNVDPAAYIESNGYIISEQGKPPDFVLEIASPSTAQIDTGPKRDEYAALGIPEYWRFDETGEHHGARLAGDRLVNGEYQPIPVEQVADDVWQGYSAALNLNIRWERGQLEWHDPETRLHIVTFEDERTGRIQAEAHAEGERTGRIQAEARVRELEAEIRRLQNG